MSPCIRPYACASPVPSPGLKVSIDEEFDLPTPSDYSPLPGGEDTGRLRASAVAINFVMACTGSTIMGIGSQMKRGGWLLTPVLVIAGAMTLKEMTLLVSTTVEHLRVNKGTQVRAYQDFAAGVFGSWGRAVSSVTATLDLLCSICIALVLEAENFQYMLPISWTWPTGAEDSAEHGRNWWAAILSCLGLLYSFVDMGPLVRFQTAVGPLVTLVSISLALAGSALAGVDADDFPESCRDSPGLPYWSLGPSSVLSPTAVTAYVLYCFAVVVTVPSLRSEMKRPQELVAAANCAYGCCAGVFIVIMLLGYWVFGNLGPDNLVEGMRVGRPDGWWAETQPWELGGRSTVGASFSALVTASMLLVDCSMVPCCVIAVEGVAPAAFRRSRAARVGARLGLVALRLLVVTEVRSFVALSALSASLFCMSNNILIPIAAFHHAGVQKVGTLRTLMHGLIFLFGCFVAIFGAYSALKEIIEPATVETMRTGIFPRPGVSAACEMQFHAAITAAHARR